MIRRISSLGWLAACVAFANAPTAVAQKTASPEGEAVLRQLIAANDRQLEATLARSDAESSFGFGGARGSGALIMTMAAAHSSQASKFHHDARLVAAMQKQVKRLRDTQNPTGLWDLGNIDSPPDSAFILKTLAKGQLFLERDNNAATAQLRGELKDVIVKTAAGV